MALRADNLEQASVSDLLAMVRELLGRVAVLEKANEGLRTENEALRKENEALRAELRESKRAKAPFSKGQGKTNPKKPGRRKGEGIFIQRTEPEVKPGDCVKEIAVSLERTSCPKCGAPLEVQSEVVTVIDTPLEPKRDIKRFTVELGRCALCGTSVRGLHPDLPSDQCGASAHRLGPNVLGQALAIHYESGLPLRKVPEVIAMTTGITMTQSALTQCAGKLCRPEGAAQQAYQQLRTAIAHAPVVNTDDTGWRTGSQPSYLMGFFTRTLAVFQVRDRHRHEEVIEMLGEQFNGLLGTDRGTSYEAKALGELRQQKCLSHLLSNLSKVETTKSGPAASFTRKLKAILRRGLDLWKEYDRGKISQAEYWRRGEAVELELTHHLRVRQLSDEDNQRLLDGIGFQHDEGRVFLFLHHPEIEPTNNRAERGLRPAVIARKVSHCSKNPTGASIYEAMKSIAATLRLRGQHVAHGLASLIRGELPAFSR